MELKLRKKSDKLRAVEIGPNFGLDRTGWPEWLTKAWRSEQPMSDGSIPPGMIVPDIGNEVRVGTPVCPEIGRPGDYIIRNELGHLGVATAGLLFSMYEEEPVEPLIHTEEAGKYEGETDGA